MGLVSKMTIFHHDCGRESNPLAQLGVPKCKCKSSLVLPSNTVNPGTPRVFVSQHTLKSWPYVFLLTTYLISTPSFDYIYIYCVYIYISYIQYINTYLSVRCCFNAISFPTFSLLQFITLGHQWTRQRVELETISSTDSFKPLVFIYSRLHHFQSAQENSIIPIVVWLIPSPVSTSLNFFRVNHQNHQNRGLPCWLKCNLLTSKTLTPKKTGRISAVSMLQIQQKFWSKRMLTKICPKYQNAKPTKMLISCFFTNSTKIP